MIFLFNAEISDVALFKRFVAGISSYPWSRVILYYENDSSTTIDPFIKKSFQHTDLILRKRINKNQQDWMDTYKLLNDDLIWISSRYDHIFVDDKFTHLDEVIEFRKKGGCDKLASIYISNWLKALKKCVIIDHGTWDGKDHTAPTFAWMTNKDCDSLQIITKELYKEWWMNGELSAKKITSPEDLPSIKKFVRPWKVQVPSREICRHVKDIDVENNFTDEGVDKTTRKERLLKYYFSHLSLFDSCLANPRVDKGILNRVMKYYGFARKN